MTDLSRRQALIPLSGIVLTVAVPTAVASSEVHPDQALLDLGLKLEKAWEVEKAAFDALSSDYTDDEANALLDPCTLLCDQIMARKANTIDGLRVKAFAIEWCWGDGYDPCTGDTIAERIEQSIIRDLLAV